MYGVGSKFSSTSKLRDSDKYDSQISARWMENGSEWDYKEKYFSLILVQHGEWYTGRFLALRKCFFFFIPETTILEPNVYYGELCTCSAQESMPISEDD